MITRDLTVYKDAGVWRWTCCRLPCGRSDRRDRHRDAFIEGLAHLARHEDFGFKPPRVAR